jgi:chemotaxis methyl-accepting protein methylase
MKPNMPRSVPRQVLEHLERRKRHTFEKTVKAIVDQPLSRGQIQALYDAFPGKSTAWMRSTA